jgi:ubiquinone/menaquinone biosynthesis C-methylase UbiE
VALFDEATSRKLEAVYRCEDAARRRRVVLAELRPLLGERVLDIGTGPGFLAREIADGVGPFGDVLAIDSSEPMLELARRRCADAPCVRVRAGDATALPAADASFDAAVSVQVYEYIADLDTALAELRRVLRPGGRAAVVSTDWTSLAWTAGDATRMRRVLEAFGEHCAHQDLPRTMAPRLRAAGFTVGLQQVLPQFNPAYDSDTFSVGLSGPIGAFVVGRRGITAAEAADWRDGLRRAGEEGRYFFCLNQYLFVATRPPER